MRGVNLLILHIGSQHTLSSLDCNLNSLWSIFNLKLKKITYELYIHIEMSPQPSWLN